VAHRAGLPDDINVIHRFDPLLTLDDLLGALPHHNWTAGPLPPPWPGLWPYLDHLARCATGTPFFLRSVPPPGGGEGGRETVGPPPPPACSQGPLWAPPKTGLFVSKKSLHFYFRNPIFLVARDPGRGPNDPLGSTVFGDWQTRRLTDKRGRPDRLINRNSKWLTGPTIDRPTDRWLCWTTAGFSRRRRERGGGGGRSDCYLPSEVVT